MEVVKQKIQHNNLFQQRDHTALLSLLSHFGFESVSSHYNIGVFIYIYISIFFLSSYFFFCYFVSTLKFFLHYMLYILRYEKISCEIGESITS